MAKAPLSTPDYSPTSWTASDLALIIRQQTGLSYSDSSRLLYDILRAIATPGQNDTNVMIRAFGRFRRKSYKARVQTTGPIALRGSYPAYTTLLFDPSSHLIDYISGTIPDWP